jgi:hypothetical protein
MSMQNKKSRAHTLDWGNNFSVSKVEVAKNPSRHSRNSGSRSDIAFSKLHSEIATATAWVWRSQRGSVSYWEGDALTIATASTKGTLITLFSCIPIIYDGVSGVASRRVSTALTACRVGCQGEHREPGHKKWDPQYRPGLGQVHKVCRLSGRVLVW